ncbi:MAG: hypothetical protein ABSF26_08285 [Thermoguttaceae bacterium]|jgi:hypothetical protein
MSLEKTAKKLAEAKKQREEVDWNAERDWWLAALGALYNQIEVWLAPLREQGLVSSARVPVQLSEEKIGTYTADQLVLEFGPEAIVLEPKGCLIVGARGRVDVFRRGSRGEQVMLVLSGSKAEPRWEIWPNRDPRQRKVVRKASFEKLLETLLQE